MRLPILRGSLRGRWWLPGAGGKVMRVLLSTYEERQTALFQAIVRPGHTVLDVGAHVGYYTLLAAELAGVTGRVVAFEPDPRNYLSLKRHVQLNRCVNVTTEQAAVAAHDGEFHFAPSRGTGMGRLERNGALKVRTVRLDSYASAKRLRPDVLKVDVEGGELDVLRGGEELLRRGRPTIFLSTHGTEVSRACRAMLAGLGYDVLGVDDDDTDIAAELLCVDALSVPPPPR